MTTKPDPNAEHTLTYFQGGRLHTMTVPRSHYDLACAYLRRSGIDISDADEVIVNFTEAELRDILNRPDEED